jgi:hypothetical protein
MKIFFIFIFFSVFISCDESSSNTQNDTTQNSTTFNASSEIKQNNEVLSDDLLGNYHGIQPSYFMKNQYGDDMIINGNKVPVPSVDYKFLLKENNVVSLQQINLEDNSRVYYDGVYKVLENDNDIVKIECSLSDGRNSKPIYFLTINKSDKKGFCNGAEESEFVINKINK